MFAIENGKSIKFYWFVNENLKLKSSYINVVIALFFHPNVSFPVLINKVTLLCFLFVFEEDGIFSHVGSEMHLDEFVCDANDVDDQADQRRNSCTM